MKRVEAIPAQKPEQEAKVTYSTAEVLQGLQSLRSKVSHNHPLDNREIEDVKKALQSHPLLEIIIGKLTTQQTKPMNFALTLEERRIVDETIESLQTETRNQVATTMEG